MRLSNDCEQCLRLLFQKLNSSTMADIYMNLIDNEYDDFAADTNNVVWDELSKRVGGDEARKMLFGYDPPRE